VSADSSSSSSSSSSSIAFLPGAGSFGGEFKALIGHFGPAAWLVRYPGRFGRDSGIAAASFERLVDACVEQVTRRGGGRTVLVGHSFGAYVAYAVAARLAELGTGPGTEPGTEPGTGAGALVVVGATAPGRMTVPERVTRSRSDLAAYLDDLAPGPEASEEWKEVLLDTAMQDLLLLREFSPDGFKELRCPVHAARGETDPLTTDEGIAEWRSVTCGGFSSRVFAGGHSDLLGKREFTTWLATVVEQPRRDGDARDTA
jgi:surfactin synthase thioesterase subunit